MDYREFDPYQAISIKYMQTFLAAAESENFTKAAELVNSHQALVSRTISLLEEELGIKLFRREGKKVFLTPQGNALKKAWEGALFQIRSGVEAAREMEHNDEVRIFDDYSLDKRRYLLPIVDAAVDELPSVRLRVEEHLAENIVDAVKNGKADIGFTVYPNKRFFNEEIQWKLLIPSLLYAWVHKNSRLYEETVLNVVDLKDEPIAIIDRDRNIGYNETIYGIFQEAGITPNVKLRLPNTFSLEYYRQTGTLTYFTNDLVPASNKADVRNIPINGTQVGLIAFWRRDSKSEDLKKLLDLIDKLMQGGQIK